MGLSIPNPALVGLEILVGEWSIEPSNVSSLPDATEFAKGQVRFDWQDGGAFLASHAENENKDFPDAIMVIGRDDSVQTYSVLYFDSRGVSRIYEMSFEAKTWKMWRNAPGFNQRFTGEFSADNKTITAHWDRSEDGVNWQLDFNLVYRRT
jgi:hypothetical protein